jgi:hypothetical protein
MRGPGLAADNPDDKEGVSGQPLQYLARPHDGAARLRHAKHVAGYLALLANEVAAVAENPDSRAATPAPSEISHATWNGHRPEPGRLALTTVHRGADTASVCVVCPRSRSGAPHRRLSVTIT